MESEDHVTIVVGLRIDGLQRVVVNSPYVLLFLIKASILGFCFL